MKSHSRLRTVLRQLRRDEDGATLVELALSIALFLMIFFMLLDFGRLAYNWVMAEKAVQMAARIAAVRPPACAGVPETHQVGTAAASFGTMCRSDAGVCQTVSVSCTGTLSNATANEIWGRVGGLLPGNATIANLRFQYSTPAASSDRMGFLGGPFTPVVTVEFQNLQFNFIHPLLGLARLAGASTTGNNPAPLSYPTMSVSLPGEDLALGTNG